MTLFSQKINGIELSFVVASNSASEFVTVDVEVSGLNLTFRLDADEARELGSAILDAGIQLTVGGENV